MSQRRWFLLLALFTSVAMLSGCARLNEWLEGAAEEEEAEEGQTPEEIFAEQQELLTTGTASERKGAITKIGELKLEQGLAVVIGHLADADPAVGAATLSVLQTVTGFVEKTEDERQLDPEGYDQQLAFKRQVVEQGQIKLALALKSEHDEVQYGALVVFYNLGMAPVEPVDAKERLRAQATASIVRLAIDATSPTDARLLAVETLVLYEAAHEMAQILPLLDDSDEAVRARVALAIGQIGGEAAAPAKPKLLALATDAGQPWAARWAAAAALGQLGADSVQGLSAPYIAPIPETLADPANTHDTSAPIDAYRTYAVASASTPEAKELVAQLNGEMSAVATEAEDQLVSERKKGYR